MASKRSALISDDGGKSGNFLQSSLFVFVVSTILLSVAELILSGDVIHNMTVSQKSSSQEERSYIYYFYEILLARIVFTSGIYVCNSPYLSSKSLSEKAKGLICVFLCGASLFLSLLSVFLQLQNYLFLANLEACVDSSLVDVSGGESHFFQAFMCEVEHVAQYSCSCVTKSFDCYSYTAISARTCASLTSSIRVETMWSIGFSMICSITSLLMIVSCTLALFFENFPSRKTENMKTAKWNLVGLTAVMVSIVIAYYTKKSNATILKSPYQTLTYFDGVYHLPSNATNMDEEDVQFNVVSKTSEYDQLYFLIIVCAGLLLGLAVVGSILRKLEPDLMAPASAKKAPFKSPSNQPKKQQRGKVQYENTIELMRNVQRDGKDEKDRDLQDAQINAFFDQKTTPLHGPNKFASANLTNPDPDTIQLMRQVGQSNVYTLHVSDENTLHEGPSSMNQTTVCASESETPVPVPTDKAHKMSWFSDLS